MTNIAAAIGLAQLENVGWHLERRREIAGWYRQRLQNAAGISWQFEDDRNESVCWLFTVALGGDLAHRHDDVMSHFQGNGIETRPVFHPVHLASLPRRVSRQLFPRSGTDCGAGHQPAHLGGADVRRRGICVRDAVGIPEHDTGTRTVRITRFSRRMSGGAYGTSSWSERYSWIPLAITP